MVAGVDEGDVAGDGFGKIADQKGRDGADIVDGDETVLG